MQHLIQELKGHLGNLDAWKNHFFRSNLSLLFNYASQYEACLMVYHFAVKARMMVWIAHD